MTISDEAVQASAEAIFEVRDDPYDMDEWDELDSTDREPFTCQARVALEAASPFIQAQALEEAGHDWDEVPDMTPRTGSKVRTWLRARAAALRGQG